jgi:hypothetical protein
MYVRDYSSFLPASQAGNRRHDLSIISAFALGGLLLCLVAAVYEPGFAQTLLDSLP